MKLTLVITRDVPTYPTWQSSPKTEPVVSTVDADGDPTMIAGYLRAMADSICPPMLFANGSDE